MDSLHRQWGEENRESCEQDFTSGGAPDAGDGGDITEGSQTVSPKGEGVFKTREEFQKQFDYEWNKRYREQNREFDRAKSTLEEVAGALAGFLGVEKDRAVEELKLRVYGEGQKPQSGEDGHFLADLQEQAIALSKEIGAFDLDAALENGEFQQAVTLFYQTTPELAVERAVRAVYFELYQQVAEKKAEEALAQKMAALRNRVPEGAVKPVYAVGVKPIDVDKLGTAGIIQLQNRILKGEKITL